MMTDVRPLPAILAELQETPPPAGGVLSVYLDTSPGRIAGQAHLLAYRDACKAIRASLPDAERTAFEAAAAQAEGYLSGSFAPTAPGLALFASGQADYFFALPLPRRPVDDLAWAEQAELEPLHELVDEYERIAVLLFDKERARLFTIFMGAVEERHALEDEVPGKQATGGWFALAQTRYARHHEDHVLRHAKRTIALLQRVLRAHPFDRLVLGGPDEAVSLLRQHLPRPLRRRLAGTLDLELFASEEQIRRAALEVAERLERAAEQAMLDELLESSGSAYVALGVESTLEALAERRIHLLLLADTFAASGSECRRCGRLSATAGSCPACGGPTEPLASLREGLLQQAVEQGARIEVVAGTAAARLAEHGGIGAWTRF
jgi:peptide chain release factor subunit 1